jgi:hypothetical protein
MPRLILFVDDPGEVRPPEFIWVEEWLKRWENEVRVVDYSTGGWEHLWDVEGPAEALREVPLAIRCAGERADSDPLD